MLRRLAVMLLVTSASDRFFDSFILKPSFFIFYNRVLSLALGIEVELVHLATELSLGLNALAYVSALSLGSTLQTAWVSFDVSFKLTNKRVF